MQAVSKALASQMQQLQQQVTDSITAAAALRQEKQTATDQLHQVCDSTGGMHTVIDYLWMAVNAKRSFQS